MYFIYIEAPKMQDLINKIAAGTTHSDWIYMSCILKGVSLEKGMSSGSNHLLNLKTNI